MTKTLFVAFSHALTEGQVGDAKVSLGVDKIITLAEVAPEMQKRFSQVPATATTEDIQHLAADVVSIAHYHGADFLYVAGEPGVVLHASLMAHEAGITVVQSTTARESQEILQADGTVVKTAVFKHVQWRRLF